MPEEYVANCTYCCRQQSTMPGEFKAKPNCDVSDTTDFNQVSVVVQDVVRLFMKDWEFLAKPRCAPRRDEE